MMDKDMSYDSGDDLFITQSTFRSVPDTGEAANAADFLQNAADNSGELLEYWDFSKENKQSEHSHVAPVEHDGANAGLSVDVSLDVLTDKDVDAISDKAVQDAVDAVFLKSDASHFGQPVSDEEVHRHAGKGYIFLKILNYDTSIEFGL